MKKIIFITQFILIIFFFALSAAAQINIERQRKALDRNGYGVNLEVFLTMNQGNTDVIKFDNNGSLAYRVNRHLGFLLLSFSMGEKSNERFINKGMGHLRYNYMWKSFLFGEVFNQVEYNEFTLLNFRGLIGSGPRFILVEKDKFNAAMGIALMYEHEELDIDAGVKEKITRTVRGSSYLSLIILLKEAVVFSNTIYVQPSLEKGEDVRVLNDANLLFNITKKFSFKTSFSLRFDSQPPAGVDKLDLELKNGLVLHI